MPHTSERGEREREGERERGRGREREREGETERERERSPRVGPSAAGVHDMLTRRNVGPNAYPAVAAQVHNQQFVDESGG